MNAPPSPALLDFDDALALVLRPRRRSIAAPVVEQVELRPHAAAYSLNPCSLTATSRHSHRATRDGFAIRAVPELNAGAIAVAGSLHAGEIWTRTFPPKAAIEIMTGAPVPAGADAVVMFEHVAIDPDGDITLTAGRSIATGENIVPTGSEAPQRRDTARSGAPVSAAQRSHSLHLAGWHGSLSIAGLVSPLLPQGTS